jgi:hypothetical protein
MVHFIQSYKSLVLWQKDHYSYEIEDRSAKGAARILARPTSFENALSHFYALREKMGYDKI